MAAREEKSLESLESLARGTDELCPTNDFTDAVMAAIDAAPTNSAASVLDKAQRETAEIKPTDDFVSAVMQNVGQGSKVRPGQDPEWNARVVRFSRFALVTAAAAAAFSLWLSSQAESRFDATILEDVAAVEVGE